MNKMWYYPYNGIEFYKKWKQAPSMFHTLQLYSIAEPRKHYAKGKEFVREESCWMSPFIHSLPNGTVHREESRWVRLGAGCRGRVVVLPGSCMGWTTAPHCLWPGDDRDLALGCWPVPGPKLLELAERVSMP